MADFELTAEQAHLYDRWHADRPPDDAVELLAELAERGTTRRALELGVGTGRVALPLAERGVEVHGIEPSTSKVELLRAKADGASIQVTVGDLSEVPVKGLYDVVFSVQNAFFSLLDQEDQVRCFANVAHHLAPGGAFVVEAFVPDPRRYAVADQAVIADHVGVDEVRLSLARHDTGRQRITAQHLFITEAGFRMFPLELRYAWPSELDLMARVAGLKLRNRWGGWRREPFWAPSTRHVSVYEPVPDAGDG